MQKYARLIACVLTVFALLLVSDVGALVAIKVIAFLVVQIGVGALLLKRFLTKSCASSTGLFACVGVGFAFGATAFVFVDQVFIRYRFSEQIWYSSIGALLIFCAYLNRKSLSPSRAYTALGEISPKVMILVMVLALAILLSSWFWLIPAWSFLIVGSVFVTTDNGLFKRARLFGGVSFLLGLAVLIDQSQKRPEFWSVHHLHYQFDEALDISFSKYGIFENMMAVGEPLKYHWFSHAWIGMLARVTGAEDWVVSTRVTPLIVALLISCLAFAIGQKLTKSTSGGLTVAAVFAVSPAFHVISPRISWVMTTSNSQLFGTLFVLAFVLVFINSETQLSFGNTVLLSILLATTALTKVNHAVILAAGFTGVFLFSIVGNHVLRLKSFAHYLIIVIPTMCTYLISQGVGSSSGARIGFIPLAEQMSGDFKNMVGIRREVIAIYFLVGIFGLAIILTAISLTNSKVLGEPLVVFTASAVLTGFFISILFDFGVDGRQVYFWHSASVLVWLLAGHLFYQLFVARRKSLSRKTMIWICGFSALSFLVLRALPNFNSGSDVAALLRSTSSNSAVIFPVILSSVLLLSVFKSRRLIHADLHKLTGYLVLSIVATTVVFFMSTHLTRFDDDYRSVRSESAEIVVPEELQFVGNWFAENTQDDVIVASNSFCELNNCTEQNLKIFSTTGDPEYRLSGSSTDYRMPIAIKRRFLITSFSFLTTDGKLQDWAVDRIRLSRDFGSAPTEELLARLRQFNVRYFVSDANVDDVSNWTRFGSVVYELGRYKIIDLESSS